MCIVDKFPTWRDWWVFKVGMSLRLKTRNSIEGKPPDEIIENQTLSHSYIVLDLRKCCEFYRLRTTSYISPSRSAIATRMHSDLFSFVRQILLACPREAVPDQQHLRHPYSYQEDNELGVDKTNDLKLPNKFLWIFSKHVAFCFAETCGKEKENKWLKSVEVKTRRLRFRA